MVHGYLTDMTAVNKLSSWICAVLQSVGKMPHFDANAEYEA